jgi:hypothetical protein
VKEKRTVDISEFAEIINSKVDKLEDRFKGIHIVVSGLANELRERDPKMASEIADTIANWALEPKLSEHTEEVIKIYHHTLKFGSKTDPEKLQ